jgi:hypothetical protein
MSFISVGWTGFHVVAIIASDFIITPFSKNAKKRRSRQNIRLPTNTSGFLPSFGRREICSLGAAPFARTGWDILIRYTAGYSLENLTRHVSGLVGCW